MKSPHNLSKTRISSSALDNEVIASSAYFRVYEKSSSAYFFKAKSRLGWTNIFYGGNRLNAGVEQGPDAIFDPDFLRQFKTCKIADFIFPNPEEVDKTVGWKTVARMGLDFKMYLNKNLDAKKIPVVVGGDHSVVFSSIMASLERVGEPFRFGYIQIDSHGDLNKFATSPSKNFHGMYLRALTDNLDIPEVSSIVQTKIPLPNILFIGNLDLDPEEKQFFQQQKIKNITGRQISQNPTRVQKQLQQFTQSFSYLHVSLDIDAFDKRFAPATGIPANHGLTPEQVFPILKIISRHPNFSIDLCEVNPLLPGAKLTINLAQQILAVLLHPLPPLK